MFGNKPQGASQPVFLLITVKITHRGLTLGGEPPGTPAVWEFSAFDAKAKLAYNPKQEKLCWAAPVKRTDVTSQRTNREVDLSELRRAARHEVKQSLRASLEKRLKIYHLCFNLSRNTIKTWKLEKIIPLIDAVPLCDWRKSSRSWWISSGIRNIQITGFFFFLFLSENQTSSHFSNLCTSEMRFLCFTTRFLFQPPDLK